MAQVWAMLTSATGGSPSSCTRAEICSPYVDLQIMYGKCSVYTLHYYYYYIWKQAQSHLRHVRLSCNAAAGSSAFQWCWHLNRAYKCDLLIWGVFEHWPHTGSIGFLPSTPWHNTQNHAKSLFSVAISMIFIAFELQKNIMNCMYQKDPPIETPKNRRSLNLPKKLPFQHRRCLHLPPDKKFPRVDEWIPLFSDSLSKKLFFVSKKNDFKKHHKSPGQPFVFSVLCCIYTSFPQTFQGKQLRSRTQIQYSKYVHKLRAQHMWKEIQT